MKKVILLFIVGMFFISLATSFEFDNTLRYEKDDMKVTIENAFGLPFFGSDLGSLELKSHNNVNQIRNVEIGNTVVMWYEVNYNELYEDGLGEVIFTDLNTRKIVEKNYQFVYWDSKIIKEPIYEYKCNILGNGTEVCQNVLTGEKNKTINSWVDYNSYDIPKDNSIIGIRVNVGPLERLDAVWTISGKQISKHAGFEGTYQFTDSAQDAVDRTVYTFSSQNLSFADSNRVIVVGTGGRKSAPNANVVSLTIGGISATNAFAESEGGSVAEIWYANVPTGTTGDVVVTWDTNQVRSGIGVWAIYTSNSTPFDTARFFIFNGSAYVDVPENGVVIGYAFTGSGIGVGWTGATENFEANVESNQASTGAMNNTFIGAEVNHEVDINRNKSGEDIMIVASWGPTVFDINVILNSPANTTLISDTSPNFNWTIIPTSLNITNWTLTSWFINGTLKNETTNTTIFTDENVTVIDNGTLFVDNTYIWNVESCGNFSAGSICKLSENRTFTIDTSLPVIDITSPINSFLFLANNQSIQLNFSIINVTTLDVCILEYNNTNTTINCGDNTTFSYIVDINNLTLHVNETSGISNFTTTSWTINILQINKTFNENTFETKRETFSINLNANSSLTDATLIYNGELKTTTLSNNISTSTIDIPIQSATRSFLWQFTYAGQKVNSTSTNQTVNPIIFNFCNATNNIDYIRFIFKNETISEELVTATINSNWDIWLGDGDVKKELSISNATENQNYTLCFTPGNMTLNTDFLLTYNNGQSQQRAFTSQPILTNSATQITLYLLPTFLGLFTQFQTRDIVSNPISLVKGVITRTLGASIITVASSLTDSSGLVIYFLNPDVLYTATFSKAGFNNNIFTFVPTTDIRFVTMGTGVSVNGSNISIGINYEITPTNSSLINNTLVLFGFNVSGNDEISLISMNITNQNGEVLSFQSNAGIGFISDTINTSNNTRIIGIYKIQTGSETLTISKVWIVGNEFIGDYSIFRQGTLFLDYGFDNFIRLLLVLSIIFGIVIYMSSNQLADNSESKVAVIILLIWIFSIIGWLDNPAVVSQTGIAQFGKQYGIAIMSSVAGVVFFMRRSFV